MLVFSLLFWCLLDRRFVHWTWTFPRGAVKTKPDFNPIGVICMATAPSSPSVWPLIRCGYITLTHSGAGVATRAPCRWLPRPAGSPVRRGCGSKWFSQSPCRCSGWYNYFNRPLRWFLNKLMDDRCIQISRKLWSCEYTDSIEKLFRTWPAGYLRPYEKNIIFLLHYSHHTTKIKQQQRKDLYFSAVIRQEERGMVSEDDFRVLLSEYSWKHIQGAGNTQLRSLLTPQEENWTKRSKMMLSSFMKAQTQITSHMVVEYASGDIGSFLAVSQFKQNPIKAIIGIIIWVLPNWANC